MHWPALVTLFLGFWLVANPSTFAYTSRLMALSDSATGIIMIILSWSNIYSRRAWREWALCFTGVWLLFAPLVFWAPTAGAYGNNTFTGLLVIVFSVVVTHIAPVEGPEEPCGWSYNPSAWSNRVPVIVLGLIAFFLARYMAAFQLGHINDVWDPFFGDGTEKILKSDVAHAFPISDAGLGAVAYLLEALSGMVGDTRRWQTMPWMVFLFFVLVVPAGVVSIVLIMLQPVMVGVWCTLCLATALITLITIPPAVDEVFASMQYLIECRQSKKPLWRIFWMGEKIAKRAKKGAPLSFSAALVEGFNGVTFTKTLFVSALLGVWLIISPAYFGATGAAANSDYIAGALVATFSVVATAEPLRWLRFLNLIFGLWIMGATTFLDGYSKPDVVNHFITGLSLCVLSLPQGRITQRYGIWSKYL